MSHYNISTGETLNLETINNESKYNNSNDNCELNEFMEPSDDEVRDLVDNSPDYCQYQQLILEEEMCDENGPIQKLK